MSLQLRIFIWLWITLLSVAATMLIWPFFVNQGPQKLDQQQKKYVSEQVERMHKFWNKRPNINILYKRQMRPDGGALWFYSPEEGRFMSNKVPPELKAVALELSSSDTPVITRAFPHWIAGPVNMDFDGISLQMYVNFPPHLGRGRMFSQMLKTTPFVLAGLIALLALMAYLVARQIARPLESLRHTSQRLADGDFKARVDSALLERTDEIGSLARTTCQMGQAADESLAAHKRLLSDVSHELRSPLTRLALANSILKKRLGVHPETDRIEHEVEVLNGMIEQLLSLSRMQLVQNTELKPVAFLGVLEKCVSDALYSYPKLNIHVVDSPEIKLNIMIQGDEDLLVRAIQNVLNNASRYASSEIALNVMSVTDNGTAFWCLRIEDDGVGVPETELNKLFTPFYRPEFSRQRDKGGSGLGLAIVEQAVKYHKGHVEAQLSDKGGLAIQMLFPQQPQ